MARQYAIGGPLGGGFVSLPEERDYATREGFIAKQQGAPPYGLAAYTAVGTVTVTTPFHEIQPVTFLGASELLTNSLTAPNAGTISFSFWLKPLKTAQTTAAIIYATGTANRILAYYDLTKQALYFELGDGGGTNKLTFSTPANIVTWGEWHHVLVSANTNVAGQKPVKV